MFEGLINGLSQIDWSVSLPQGLMILALVGWLWLIWPKDDLKSLVTEPNTLKRAFWASLFINGLWLLNASVKQGMDAHFLGGAVLLMMFGWRLASVLIMLPVIFFCTLVTKQPGNIGVYGLLAMLFPLFISFVFYSLSYKHLPKHLFIYIFFGGFFNAGLMLIAHVLFWGSWLWFATDYDFDTIMSNFFILIPLLGFPEALLNGMALTLLVVYRPEWLYDYSDKHYLWRK